MGELRPLLRLSNEDQKAAADDIQTNRAAWASCFEKPVGLCQAGRIADAYRFRNENKAISARMHAAATELVNQQKRDLSPGREAHRKPGWPGPTGWRCRSRSLCVLPGGALLTASRREITKVQGAGNDLEWCARDLAMASQQVAQGANQQAASVEETSSSSAAKLTERRCEIWRRAQPVYGGLNR
jgi:hypothetical protein